MKKDVIKPSEYQCKVTGFKMLTPTVFELKMELDRPLTFLAGQFGSIVIPGAGPNGRDLRRAYSIASAPELQAIEFCVKLVEDGPGTQYLYSLRPGDSVRMFAPYGDFVFRPKEGRNVCFIATGTGIAPFRSMIMSQCFQDNKPPRSYCLAGVRTEDEILYSEMSEAYRDTQFINAVSQSATTWNGYRGRVTDYLRTLGDDFPWLETEYYLCGHGGMIAEIKTMLLEKGVTRESTHQEIYYK